MLVAASHKRKTGKMWTRFEERDNVLQLRMMEHFARDCRRKASAKGKAETEARGIPKEKGKQRMARERQVQANLEDPRKDIQENWKVGDNKESAGRAARSDTRHQKVDGESPASMRKMQTAEKAEHNLNQKKMEKSEECRSSETWRISRTKTRPASITHSVKWKKAPAAWGAHPSTGQVKIHVMISV